METATIRIPEEKKNLLKAAASLENRKMNDIVIELIDEYIESRKETLELLAIPGFYKRLQAARREFREGKFVSLKDAEAFLDRKSLKSRPKGSGQIGKAHTNTNTGPSKTTRST
jgi:PHD/YefM family antitoxin component YafN of YafNO toxin-antitoxin module